MALVCLKRPHVDINSSTPLCVILKLAKTHGVGYKEDRENDDLYIEYVIEHLFSYLRFVSNLPQEWSPQDWSKVARFVNPCVSGWSNSSLLEGYNHILNYKVEEFTISDRFGPKTNRCPERLDEIQTWNLCCYLGVTTTRETSYIEMIELIRLTKLSPTWRHLLGISGITSESIAMGIVHQDFSQLKYTPNPKEIKFPLDNNQAISMGIDKGYDFTMAQYPILECCIMLSDVENYSPVDTMLRQIAQVNPARIKFGYYFNPLITSEQYPMDKLNYFRSLECIDRTSNKDDLYSALYERSLKPTFHHLSQPEINHKETRYTLEPITSGDSEVISYGILSFSQDHFASNTMVGYKLVELTMMFRSNQNFIDSLSGERFSKASIRKLNKLCLCITNSNLGDEIKKNARDLVQEISKINLTLSGLECRIQGWLTTFEESKSTIKDQVVLSLNLLLQSGMYMRTWRGPSQPYPLNERMVTDQDVVDQLVGESLIKWSDVDRLIPKQLQISQLPLKLYEMGNFIGPKDPSDGATIGERVELISKGNLTEEIRSCIRVSSNWVVGSAYFYLQLLNQRPGFNIEDMYPIS